MLTVKNYKTISSNTLEDLNKKVNEMLKDDWQPLGPASIIYLKTSLAFYQTMVQYPRHQLGTKL